MVKNKSKKHKKILPELTRYSKVSEGLRALMGEVRKQTKESIWNHHDDEIQKVKSSNLRQFGSVKLTESDISRIWSFITIQNAVHDTCRDFNNRKYKNIFIESPELVRFLESVPIPENMDFQEMMKEKLLKEVKPDYISHEFFAERVVGDVLSGNSRYGLDIKSVAPVLRAYRYTIMIHVPDRKYSMGFAMTYTDLLSNEYVDASGNRKPMSTDFEKLKGFAAKLFNHTVFLYSEENSSGKGVATSLFELTSEELAHRLNTSTMFEKDVVQMTPGLDKFNKDSMSWGVKIIVSLFYYMINFPDVIKQGMPENASFSNDFVNGRSNLRIGIHPKIISHTSKERNGKVTTHFRSGHYRVLKDERYTKARFKTIFVQSTIVNRGMDTITVEDTKHVHEIIK
jgi:hypothetical protein